MCAKKNEGSLNFPSLITALCRIAQVPFNVEEDIIPNKGGLTSTSFVEIQGTDAARATQHSHATTSSTVKSLKKNFMKPMLEFPIFSATLLPFADAAKEPTQATTKAPTQPTTEAPTQTLVEEHENTTSLNAEMEE
ncbi:hypothetical protein PVK06_005593 [Gossypium arboreum]|uniref:Uncharacterized protein n=1 Tax=Gossypium arboreum TaxID=29729 RepID=A0ABR0QUZ8_GOSAR|nr:hypothetical protein PVK06_005593 [Gossypium arboreum]